MNASPLHPEHPTWEPERMGWEGTALGERGEGPRGAGGQQDTPPRLPRFSTGHVPSLFNRFPFMYLNRLKEQPL